MNTEINTLNPKFDSRETTLLGAMPGGLSIRSRAS
jgi:hypothetical protein